MPVITVAGEALIDLIVDPAGHVHARPGGGPFNAARAMARLGLPVAFLGRLSADRFGGLLRDSLAADGVALAITAETAEPSTLAVVHIGPGGMPEYSFYLPGTSAFQLDYTRALAALPPGTAALHVGGLALAVDPAGRSLEQLVAAAASTTLVLLDPNCRPQAITRPRDYAGRIARVLRRADAVKASVEDLEYLYPGLGTEAAAAELLGAGATLVMITDGPRPARGFGAGFQVAAEVPPVTVVDTVGAGDAFGGAFLGWWTGQQLGRADLRRADAVRAAMSAAAEAAALTCARAGAEPPWAAELASRPGWDWLARPVDEPA